MFFNLFKKNSTTLSRGNISIKTIIFDSLKVKRGNSTYHIRIQFSEKIGYGIIYGVNLFASESLKLQNV